MEQLTIATRSAHYIQRAQQRLVHNCTLASAYRGACVPVIRRHNHTRRASGALCCMRGGTQPTSTQCAFDMRLVVRPLPIYCSSSLGKIVSILRAIVGYFSFKCSTSISLSMGVSSGKSRPPAKQKNVRNMIGWALWCSN